MRLDRNIEENAGKGKYALILLRNLDEDRVKALGLSWEGVQKAIQHLEHTGLLDWGTVDTESEFFVIRLKDKYAEKALRAYADAAKYDDPEWASEVYELAGRAGMNSQWCKRPE